MLDLEMVFQKLDARHKPALASDALSAPLEADKSKTRATTLDVDEQRDIDGGMRLVVFSLAVVTLAVVGTIAYGLSYL